MIRSHSLSSRVRERVTSYYAVHSHGRWSLLGLNAKGYAVNAINGDKGEGLKALARAAHKHWPGARAVRRTKVRGSR
jgi:hypothetical protein